MADSPARIIVVCVGVAALSWLLVGAMRRYSITRGIVDLPSARSSHRTPTPRGGGAGLLAASFAGFLILLYPARLTWPLSLGLVAVVAAAVIGWIDDRGSTSVPLRVAAHIAAGFLLAPVPLGDERGAMAVLLVVGCVFATVAAINVINFMDGIDGIIGLQACIFGLHLALVAGTAPVARLIGVTLAAGAIGFLAWNWAPARIFLGDVGSGALAVLALLGGLVAWRRGGWPFMAIFLPLLPLFLDAAATLFRRAVKGEALATPHRSHLYQRLANDAAWGHARVALLYGVVAAAGSFVAVFTRDVGQLPAWAAYAIAVTGLGWVLERAVRLRTGAHSTPSQLAT